MRTRKAKGLRFAAFVFLHVVLDAEARAGSRIHLLRCVDGVLQLGDAIFHLGELFFDLILEVADFLLGHLERGLVELSLLISQDRHHYLPSMWLKRRGL